MGNKNRDGYRDLARKVFSPAHKRELESSFHDERSEAIKQACEWADQQNYRVTSTQMCQRTGMAIAAFREAFRIHTGEWPGEWILQKRKERNKHGSV